MLQEAKKRFLNFMLLPVLKGCLSYESLKNGAIDLADIVILNRALYEESEAQKRAYEAQAAKIKRG